jgi:hypothetical protein
MNMRTLKKVGFLLVTLASLTTTSVYADSGSHGCHQRCSSGNFTERVLSVFNALQSNPNVQIIHESKALWVQQSTLLHDGIVATLSLPAPLAINALLALPAFGIANEEAILKGVAAANPTADLTQLGLSLKAFDLKVIEIAATIRVDQDLARQLTGELFNLGTSIAQELSRALPIDFTTMNGFAQNYVTQIAQMIIGFSDPFSLTGVTAGIAAQLAASEQAAEIGAYVGIAELALINGCGNNFGFGSL